MMKFKLIQYLNTKQNKRRRINNKLFYLKIVFFLFLLIAPSKEGDELGFIVASRVNALVTGCELAGLLEWYAERLGTHRRGLHISCTVIISPGEK